MISVDAEGRTPACRASWVQDCKHNSNPAILCRAARFCLSAAYGGQIVAPIETVQKIIAEWTQQPCPPMLENGRPIVSVKVGHRCHNSMPASFTTKISICCRCSRSSFWCRMYSAERANLTALHIFAEHARGGPVHAASLLRKLQRKLCTLEREASNCQPCVQQSPVDGMGMPGDGMPHGHPFPSQLSRIQSVDAAVEAGQMFQRILLDAGFPCTFRQRRGIDVAAGCGQLKADKIRKARVES